MAEDKDLVALLHELGNVVDQSFQFGALHVSVGGIDQARMAADLPEPEEGGEYIEALLVEFGVVGDGTQLLLGAFEFGIVEIQLIALELACDGFLDAVWQVGSDLLLGAPQHEVTRAIEELLRRFGIRFLVLAFEGRLTAEQSWHGEGEKAPEVEGSVLDRRASQDKAMFGLERAGGFSGLRLRVLDVLAFVEQGDSPLDFVKEPLVDAQLAVIGDEDVDVGRLPRSGMVAGGIENADGEQVGVSFHFLLPDVHDRFGADDDCLEGFFWRTMQFEPG